MNRRTGFALRARGLVQSFGERSVLDGVDLELAGGDILAVVGVSGSGKSTLLYALAGLRQPDGGMVEWRDHADVWSLGEPDITLVRRATCGFVFQFPAFLDDLTVAANVGVPLVVSGTKKLSQNSGLCSRLRLMCVTDLHEEVRPHVETCHS